VTTLYNPASGDEPTAAQIATLAPKFVRRSANQNRTGTTLSADNTLSIAVSANTTWRMHGELIYTTPIAALINFGWIAPAGATLDWTVTALASTDSGDEGIGTWRALTLSDFKTCGGDGTTPLWANVTGTLVVGSTAGSLTVTWCQGNNNATNTVMRTGSTLELLQRA
jgi:hypothetical protein